MFKSPETYKFNKTVFKYYNLTNITYFVISKKRLNTQILLYFF